jgi:GDP-L-fucose synthase
MKILVAGATGLAGSAIHRELLQIGKKVVGISSKDLDLLDRKATFEYLKNLKPNVVIDAAAKVGGISANINFPVELLSENIQIQTNLMDASHKAGVDQFVFLSSNCVYPKNCPQPMKEEYISTGLLEPTNSAYAIAKLSGMELINSYRREFKHKWISVIPASLYGPNDNFDIQTSHVFGALIEKFVEAKRSGGKSVNLFGSGKPLREFLHVKDLAKAIVICLERYDSDEPINIGSGIDLTIKALASKIAKLTEFNGQVIWDTTKPDGMPQKKLDIEKITQLGWRASIPLEVGISSTLNWYYQKIDLKIS